jgi:hypothetical protein
MGKVDCRCTLLHNQERVPYFTGEIAVIRVRAENRADYLLHVRVCCVQSSHAHLTIALQRSLSLGLGVGCGDSG